MNRFVALFLLFTLLLLAPFQGRAVHWRSQIARSHPATDSLTISSVQPQSGVPETIVQIRGAGFAPSPSGNVVTFGDVEAPVDSAQANVIYARVPVGIDGPVQVSVQTGSETAFASSFSVLRRGKNVFEGAVSLNAGADGDVAWSDFDRDGDMDIAVTGNGDGPETTIYRNEGNGNFIPLNAGLTGTFRSSVAWGDYNHDGLPDLAISGFTGSGPVTVIYRNQGGSSFQPVGAGIPGVGESDLAWADFDEDGDLDLAITGETSDNVPKTRLYRNNGGGTFTQVGAGLTDVRESRLSWVDFNGDGHLDLSLVGRTENFAITTKLYAGDGQGNFSAIDADVSGRPESSLVWGDYDADGDPDLAVPGKIYRNEGGNSFTELPGPDFRDASLQWGDHDADGDLDLAVAGESGARSPTARIYRNEGDGVFKPIETGLTGVQRASVEWADLGGDGDLDLAVAGRDVDESDGDGSVTNLTKVYRNQASPQRPPLSVTSLQPYHGAPGTPIRIRGAGFHPNPSRYTITFGDAEAPVDSVEGKILYTSVPSGIFGPVEVSVQSPDKEVSSGRMFTPSSGGDSDFSPISAGLPGFRRAALDWGDFDGDGDLDLLVAGRPSDAEGTATRIYENEGNQTFSAVGAGLPGVGQRPSVEWGDYDGDGDLDLALAGRGNSGPTSQVYRNDGEGTFTRVYTGIEYSSVSLSWGDYDGDGDLDLGVAGTIGTTLVPKTKVYRNDGNDTFTSTGAGVPEAGKASLDWGDADGDGHIDLAIHGKGVEFSNLGTYAENQQGTFRDAGASLGGGSNETIQWRDFDGDGHLDVAVTGIGTIFRGSGNGNFSQTYSGMGGISDASLRWGDYNGDGRPDFVLAGKNPSRDPETRLYKNDGDGAFSEVSVPFLDVEESAVAWGDYDGDGDLDLALAGKKGRSGDFAPTFRIYENQGTPIPVELSGFSATQVSDGVRLTWQTASETDNAGFEVQRRQGDDGVWRQVSYVQSKAQGGTTTDVKSYSYTAEDLQFGTHHFRLKQVDLDGGSTLTDPVSVDIQMQEAVKLSAPAPNPARSTTTLSFAIKERSKTTITLYNTLGQRVITVYEGTPPAGEQQTTRIDATDLPSGTYFLRLSAGGQTRTQRLTIVR